MLIIQGHIEQYGKSLFIAWAERFPGLVVQGSSIDQVIKELWTSLRVKVAFDYKLDISRVEVKSLAEIPILEGATDEEFKFQLM